MYLELGCIGKEIFVVIKWGVFEDIYCFKEEIFIFLEDVLIEVVMFFFGEYIYIGGDEVFKIYWENCN